MTVELDSLKVEGLTSIVDASVEFGRLNVLVGANGAGKSNFVGALGLLGRIVDGGLRRHVRLLRGGSSALLGARARPPQIRLSLRGRSDAVDVAYDVLLTPTQGNEFIVDEWVSDWRVGSSTSIGRGNWETSLMDAEAGPGEWQTVASTVIALLRGCRVYHFHDTSEAAAVKKPGPTSDNLALHPDARNLAAVLLALRDDIGGPGAVAYRRILTVMRQVAPCFGDLILVPEPGVLGLRWREAGLDSVFSAHGMSDGTLRFLSLATLLLQPQLPALVVLDEPELGLHPYAIVQLAGLLRQASVRSQIVVATQSVTLMNEFDLSDLLVVERRAQERREIGSVFIRPDREKLSVWLEDYSVGELWEKNLIGGRPGSIPGLAGG